MAPNGHIHAARASLPALAAPIGMGFPALLGALACLVAVLPAAARADVPASGALYQDGPSGRYLVAGTWYRRADPRDSGRKQRWERKTGLAGWQQTGIPNAANVGDYSARSFLGGVWWYRRDFQLPDSASATTWLVRFESVNYRATVWLNGRRLGSHRGAFLPFELQAKALHRTGTNRLVVRVDSRRGRLDVPSVGRRKGGRYVGGWWNYAGILREVYLRKVQGLDFANVLARPELKCRTCPATVTVRAIVANYDRLPAGARVEGTIGSDRLQFSPATIAARGFHIFTATVRLDHPRLWSPAAPNLYRARLRLVLGGHVVQTYSLHTGVRSIQVGTDGRLLLNGEHLTLRGASIHEDDPQKGGALGPAEIRGDVDLLRELGANMTRAPYPLHPLALELADRYGILVWSEVPVYQMGDKLFRRPAVRRQARGLLRDLVNRDRSHPSVLVWSVGNENSVRPGPGYSRYVRSAARLVRQLDPTRLVGLSFPGYPTVGKQDLYTGLDALGVNDYFGWYSGPQGSLSDRNGLAPYLERLHHDYRRQALFVTELGAEANRAGPATEKGTYAFQQDFLTFHLGIFAAKPFVNGALVWILRDYHVKPGYAGGNPKPRPPLGQKGLVDLTGARKPAFDTVKQLLHGTQAKP